MQEITMSQAIWQVMVDAAIMGTLLMLGTLLRSKIKLLQKVLIPPAVIAGVMALLLGPKSPIEALRILPLSAQFGTYASVLIVLVFAATPIGDKPQKGAMKGSKMMHRSAAVCGGHVGYHRHSDKVFPGAS